MEISNALLVALMFVTILVLGIANILVSLAAIVRHPSAAKDDAIFNNWKLLLLLAHFNLFWHTLDLLSVDLFLGPGLTGASVFNAVVLALALSLAFVRQHRFQIAGLAIAWLLYLASLVLQGLGVIV